MQQGFTPISQRLSFVYFLQYLRDKYLLMTDRVTRFGQFLLLIAAFVAAELYNVGKKNVSLEFAG